MSSLKLHNAMWPGLVGKGDGDGQEPPISLERMLDLTAAAEVNGQVENIGARRLQTVMEKLLDEVSFDAEDRAGTSLVVDAAYVDSQLASIARDTDLSRYVL